MQERWFATVKCREEHAQGNFEPREFGPFKRQVGPLDVFQALHLMGWEGHHIVQWQAKPIN